MSYKCPIFERQHFKRSSFRQLLLSESGVRNAIPIPGIPMCIKLKYKRPEGVAVGSASKQSLSKEAKEHPSI